MIVGVVQYITKYCFKRSVTPGNVLCNLSHNGLNCVLQHCETRGVTMGNVQKSCRRVAAIVAKSRTEFNFSQHLWQRKKCETCPLLGMLH